MVAGTLMTVAAAASAAAATAGSSRSVDAAFIGAAITLDGRLDEAAWSTVTPAMDFVQRDPSEGEPATEATEVRVLYDQNTLYVGARCYDRTPARIVVRDVTRDFEFDEQDGFGILIDTFDDNRSGFLLATTPAGGELDVQVLNENRDVNYNWDGVWHVQTRIDEQGWTAEFAIPLKTLRFATGRTQVWGIQFFRRLRRRNETSVWSPVPKRYRNNFQVSRSGALQGLANLMPGKNLTVKPFALGGVSRFWSRPGSNGEFDGGLDVKYGVTPGMTLDATVNTDFSQVEVDTQQVNLTRYPLFFPEKREFFLENAGLFQLGESYRHGPPRTEETYLFFSRRIGLSAAREPIPILAGARLTGRARGFYTGLINIQTRSAEATPASNFTVARVRRDILGSSDVGVMLVNRQSSRPDDYNRGIGADANFVFREDLRLNAVAARTSTPGLSGHDALRKLEVYWQNSLLHVIGSYLDVQQNFNPEVGYVRRKGRILHGAFGTDYRVRRDTRLGSFVRDVNSRILMEYVTRPGGPPDTKLLRSQVRLELQDGGGVEMQHLRNFERLAGPFAIHPGITVAAGDYRYDEWLAWYFTNKSKPLSVEAKYKRGQFYSGRKSTLTANGKFQAGYRLSTVLNYERNDVSLREGAFITNLVGLRVNYSFSARMFLNAFIQYNNDTDQVGSNIRFRFIHGPLSDFFILYNGQQNIVRRLTDHKLTIKYTRLLSF